MSSGDPKRIARQHAQTSELLGVPFIPAVGRRCDAVEESGEAPPVRSSAASGSKLEALAELRARYERESPLVKTMPGYTNIVFGDGDPDAALMFVGKAPGADEDAQGIPFVGRAGKKLNEMIIAMGLRREDVYIANILKVRPPKNRTPTIEEAQAEGRGVVTVDNKMVENLHVDEARRAVAFAAAIS